MKVSRNFTKGRMNKVVDERLIPDGEYIDAMNIRLGSTEQSEMGAIENTKGNEKITTLQYNGVNLSNDAIQVGVLSDSESNTIYWCVHDPNNPESATGIVDMVVAYDTINSLLIYIAISTDDGSGTSTTLNFNPTYRVNAMNKIGDLLFISDNYNPPRRFNIREYYSEPTYLDINVIVQPPLECPRVIPIKQNGQETYLDTRFLSFAYRYKYKNGEYSALSQFSKIAFAPNDFSLDVTSSENLGMTNLYNSAIIFLNTSSENVIEVDLIFKFSNSDELLIVDKYNKANLGWANNSSVSVSFTNKKVYTTLSSTELLRSFDNVPHTAQAQTIMGNRLMYANYVDGYDIVDANGNSCRLGYTTEVISLPVETQPLNSEKAESNYTIDTAETIPNSEVTIFMAGIEDDLIEGSRLSLTLNISHNKYETLGTFPLTTSPSILINVSITLDNTYATLAAFFGSAEFENAIGEITFTPFTDCGTVDAGGSLTDQIRCGSTPPFINFSRWQKVSSGITADDEGIALTFDTEGFTLQMIAMKYESVNSPGVYLYEYFSISSVTAIFYKEDIGRSLHSDRDFEVGIVYMDEYNRSTTALVSQENTVFIDPDKSIAKNNIRVTIPTTQKPPYWATRYKFVLKPSELNYEVIYSNMFFYDALTNTTWFKLNGTNQTKAVKGQILRVKRDLNGAITRRVETPILDMSAKGRNFLPDNFVDGSVILSSSDAIEVIEPAGFYMQINTSNFNADPIDGLYLTDGVRIPPPEYALYPLITSFVYEPNPFYNAEIPISPTNPVSVDWFIPIGSIVTIKLQFTRRKSLGDPQQDYYYNKTYVASQSYDNLYEFVEGEDIRFDTGESTTSDDEEPNENTYLGLNPFAPLPVDKVNQYWFDDTEPGSATGMLFYILSGSKQPHSTGSCEIVIISAENTFIFETVPTEADSNVYYEDSENFTIFEGFHQGNLQNQTASLPAIIDLSFFDCFSFGNGAESYKIGDNLATPSFRLGERFYAVSQEEYKEANRYADITYSGIYNAETNINKLNEFNLALANFKSLEKSFGPIRVIDARANDVLILQEDKISYVLAGKDLLSTPLGSSGLFVIPEVLGSQITRIENFGISNNPESYAVWGFDKYFTDIKRGAVLKLSGAGQAEQLSVISELGMRSWFRDYFKLTQTTQKLGGYDPYMNEYVLSCNLNSIPTEPFVSPCGVTVTQRTNDTVTEWDILLLPGTGMILVNYTIGILPVGETVTVNVTHNGVLYTSGAVTVSGAFPISKALGVDTAFVEVILSSSFQTSFSVKVGCAEELAPIITQVGLAGDSVSPSYIHNDFFWMQDDYVSPTQSELVTLVNTPETLNISQYQTVLGRAGFGVIPPTSGNQVTIRIQSTKRDFDNFIFGGSTFRYALTENEYDNTQVDITNLLAASTEAPLIQNPSTGIYYYDIAYDNSSYIYLIYDYR